MIFIKIAEKQVVFAKLKMVLEKSELCKNGCISI